MRFCLHLMKEALHLLPVSQHHWVREHELEKSLDTAGTTIGRELPVPGERQREAGSPWVTLLVRFPPIALISFYRN